MGVDKFRRKVVAPRFSGIQSKSDIIRVANVTELEAAIGSQVAGHVIEVEPGDYVLTESMSILSAASGGGIVGKGLVTITGAADADEAILVDIAERTSTFEYFIKDIDMLRGGADKIGLHVKNTNINKKTIITLDNVCLQDNGSGVGLTVVNTDTDNAIRIYAKGSNTSWDGVAITPKNDGDKFYFDGINFEENLVVAAVDIAADFKFTGCQLPHEGVTGGHATNVINVINCFTIETTAAAIPDSNDFPDAFSPTIVPAS